MTPPPDSASAALPAPDGTPPETADATVAASAAPAADTRPATPYDVFSPAAGPNFYKAASGIKSWLVTLDHKRIGMMYLVCILGAFVLGGFFAVMFRTAHMSPAAGLKAGLVTAEFYNQLFTLHGAVMVFLVIIPGVPASLGNFILPLMIGAKDVAFPRLNLTSFYLWLIGAVLFVGCIIMTGLDTGWTFYAPYSTRAAGSHGALVVIMATSGAFILGFSSIFTGMNFMVTIHKLRAPGMTWFRMPAFLWGIYATALIQVLATPVLGITLLLLIVENSMQVGIFNPALGGDPVLFQHFFWFYSHPAVYIMILPAMAVMSELIAVHSHKHLFGYKFIVMSSVAIAILGFLVWGHHMFTSGQSNLLSTIFSALTFLIAIPSAIKVFNWLTTMYKGSISLNTPCLYAISFMFIFTIGGLTGLFLSTLSTDIHLHDTYFVVAHFHYVMAGTIFAMFGGVYHWWPKMTGKMYHENSGRLACALMFIGFNLTFLPQFVMGSQGMPRRYWQYDDIFTIYHQASTVGSWVMGLGVIVMFWSFFMSITRGKKAPANPWGGASMEWRCSSPPPHFNFDDPPKEADPYAFTQLVYDPTDGGYIHRADLKEGVEYRNKTVAVTRAAIESPSSENKEG